MRFCRGAMVRVASSLQPLARAHGLELSKELADVFEREVLPGLDAKDHAMLGQVGSAWRALVAGCSARTCALAAAGGNLEVLQWAQARVARGCPWDETTCEGAAENGRAAVGAGERLRVGWGYYVRCRSGRTLGASTVVPAARVPAARVRGEL